jgi:uncharacterized DUF497 family protein
MEFEFDPGKSSSNRRKHGIDFESARLLWADERRIVVPARNTGEERFALVASLHGRIWTCIFTHRAERIRIISIRRARYEEESRYHLG